MDSDFDLIVVGGGSGGLAGAFRAAALGARVALLEPADLGGTCVNVGCVPKKAMWLAAETALRLRMAGSLGFAKQDCRLDWPEFVAHRQRYIQNIHASYRKRLDAAAIATLPVRGQLLDGNTVQCDNGVQLRTERILLATGGHATRPDIPGADLGDTSDGFFEWTAPPKTVAIVGGGYIAVELAGVLQALGSQVEMFVRGERMLASFDVELVDQLIEDYRQAGVHLHFETESSAVEREDDGLVLVDGQGKRHGPFEKVLFATGRSPNSSGLGLDATGVELDDKGHVVIDDGQATSVPGIFAVGDLGTDLPLTPVAIAAARRLMDRLYGGIDRRLDRDAIPTVLFSHPPIGKVGLDEAAARALHGDDVHVFRTGFRPMLHALADSPQRSVFKLVCVGEAKRIVGIHLMGEAADEILQGFAVAMRMGATLDDLHDTVAIHPTSAEEVVLMR